MYVLANLFFSTIIKNMEKIDQKTKEAIMSRPPITATDTITGRFIWLPGDEDWVGCALGD